MKACSKLTVSVKVTNSGKLNGDEVAQLYVSQQNPNIHAPLKALKGFKRISLKAGESRIITFHLAPEDLSVPDDKGSPKHLTGKILISVGGGQPGIKNRATSNVVSKTISIL
jgi:beta-glucosidase